VGGRNGEEGREWGGGAGGGEWVGGGAEGEERDCAGFWFGGVGEMEVGAVEEEVEKGGRDREGGGT